MKWLGYREVRDAEIIARPEDEIARRIFDPNVRALAESFDTATGGEPGNAPWVSEVPFGYHLVAGRDRFAALLLKGATSLWVRVGEFDQRGLLLAEVHENVHRRDVDRNALLARLVDETEAEIAAPDDDEPFIAPGGQKPGRPKTTRQKAREQVAEETGLTPQAVRRAEQKSGGASAGSRQPPPEVEPPIDMRGLNASEDWVRSVAAVSSELELIEGDLREAKKALAALAKLPFHPSRLDALKTKIAEALFAVEQAAPASACHQCNDPDGSNGRAPKCGVCLGQGYIVRSQASGVVTATKTRKPAPLHVQRTVALNPDGSFQRDESVAVVTVPSAALAPAPKRPKPRNRIVMVREDGGESPFDPGAA